MDSQAYEASGNFCEGLAIIHKKAPQNWSVFQGIYMLRLTV